MAIEFRDRGTEDIYNGVDSKAARKVCPRDVVRRARAKLFLIDDAESIGDLRVPPGNRLEVLKGDRKGQHSIRFESTSDTASASGGRRRAPETSKSWTTIPERSESRMVRVPTHRPPTHPGEMLLEEFLEPLGMTQTELAERIEVPFQRINSLVNGRRAVTPDTALRLARVFGTSPAFWMNHQLRWDLYHAQREAKAHLQRIKPVPRTDLVPAE